MRQNPSFAMTDVGEIRRLIEHNPWVTLVASTPDGLVASHYAVLLDDFDDPSVELASGEDHLDAAARRPDPRGSR